MFTKMSTRVRAKNFTYLSAEKLEGIGSCLSVLKSTHVPGHFMEFGVALGGSSICIASELDAGRSFFGFDLFGMIPPPSERDGPGTQARYETIKSGKSRGIAAINITVTKTIF